jgi:SpoVK/Ycf46/Vps4 family AAA+-type ATPase
VRSKLVKELVESRQHIREKIREAIDTAEAINIEEEFQAFHKRRAEQIAEAKVNIYELSFLSIFVYNAIVT